MSLPLKTGFPDGVTLSDGAVIRWTATNPTTGALVPGVKISQTSLFVDIIAGEAAELLGPFILEPGVVSEPL